MDLIAIEKATIGKNEVNAVDGRGLWKFLQSKQEFTTWMKNRIDKYEFIETVDFISFNKFVKANNVNKTTKEYMLSIDMAKELSMVENNPRGKQARTYFIQLQKKAENVLKIIESIEFTGNVDNLVYAREGQGFTNSNIIAIKFEKKHFDVLRLIDNKIKELQQFDRGNQFSRCNFTLTSYKDHQNKTNRQYELTEQGLSLIALELTGKKALEFKVEFINAFFKIKQMLIDRIVSEKIQQVLPQNTKKRQFVYIIKNPATNLLKIGVSKNVEKRLKQLQTGAGAELELLYKSMVCSNAFKIEQLLHENFKDNQVFGEWYDITLQQIITELEKSSFVLEGDFLESYYGDGMFKITK